jgi:hypothetical protein
MKPDVKARWRDPVYVITLAAMLLVAGIGIYLSTTLEGAVRHLLAAWMTASLAAMMAFPSRDYMPGRGIPVVLMLVSFVQLAFALHFLRML